MEVRQKFVNVGALRDNHPCNCSLEQPDQRSAAACNSLVMGAARFER
jgi:hypothetical protein